MNRRQCHLFVLALAVYLPLASIAESKEGQQRVARIFAGNASPQADDLASMQQQIQAISPAIIAATVGVRVANAHGSGVIVSADGYVLTAAHVAGKPNQRAAVILADGSEYQAKTLGLELGMDAGMVKLESSKPTGSESWPSLPMADSKMLRKGQWCLATGHPGGFRHGRQPVLRIGRILNNNFESEVLTDCTLVGGDSGGPLLDMRGRVIGIHSRIGAPLDANLHVPTTVFRDGWDGLVNSETHGPYLGISQDEYAEQARVRAVTENSPADRAGLKSGDVVITFDDHPIDDFQQLREYVLVKRPGDRVRLGVIRDGTSLDLTVALGDWSDSAKTVRR